MSGRSEIGIQAPTVEERFLQERENLVSLLAEGGDYLIKVFHDVRREMPGISVSGSFFVSVYPRLNQEVGGFKRQYGIYPQAKMYRDSFPRVALGLTLEREICNWEDIDQVKFILGKYPAVKVSGEYPRQQIEVKYPLVVVSPKSHVLEQLWTNRYGVETFPPRRHPLVASFSTVFNQQTDSGFDYKYHETTVLAEPERWSKKNSDLFVWLIPCLVDAAVLTFTKDVRWQSSDVNRAEYIKRSDETKIDNLTSDQFQKLVLRAKQVQQAQNGTDVIGLLGLS